MVVAQLLSAMSSSLNMAESSPVLWREAILETKGRDSYLSHVAEGSDVFLDILWAKGASRPFFMTGR